MRESLRSLVVCSALLAQGCGPILWAITPKQEVTQYEVTRGGTAHLVSPDGGPPRFVYGPYKEIRHQRKKSTVPALVGLLVDVIGGSVMTLITQDVTDEPGMTITVGTLFAGAVGLNMYLISSRSIEDRPVALEPLALDAGVQREPLLLQPPGLTPVR